ncbi:NACHT, LRR and PYD domains-containing protein 14 [Heracleum sosnowskyi]|uniref:NACHT, LRR and PYD domains-containing protein 14 n=1 Tax=Heracleum sosnowskyi TaxID=360622 RepID=A0AAD8GS02_9APIA|nr:NACHT, LRR and PYD domains-containing protein 14 [Heracleum sosnowskyi]
MREAPSLYSLCLDSIKDMILFGDDDLSCLYQLPTEIIDCLIPRLPAIALQKFQDALPLNHENGHEVASGSQRKRKRCDNFETAWMTLYKSRFSGFRLIKPADCSYCHAKRIGTHDFRNEWQELYWNSHIQKCLSVAAEKAVLPYFEGCLGEIKIPDSILLSMGYKQCGSYLEVDYSKLAYHCQHFGLYARYLTLQNVLLQTETCHLLRNSKLEALVVQWIKSKEQVEGVCKLLSQNIETMASLRFNHCKLSSEFVNAICESLLVKDLPTHRIQHFTFNTSRLLEADSISIPAGLKSFLSSARCLCTADFRDSELQQNFARMIFSALFDASSNIAFLDLSENNISGWLSHFKWKPSSHLHVNPGICTLKSLCVLKLRGNNLRKDDADCLNYALFHMPNLETLDLGDNPIEDDGIMTLMPYFTRMAERITPLIDLNLEECKLTCHGIKILLQVLSSFKKPLNSLRIGDNNLGSEVGVQLGKFICTGIKELHFHDIGINSSGFVEAQEQITGGVKLVFINIRGNPGGVGAAKFISKLIVLAPELIKIDASYNVLPAEAVPIISSSLEIAKGNLKHLDLTGNAMCSQPASIAMLKKYVVDGHIDIVLPVPNLTTQFPYDDDP